MRDIARILGISHVTVSLALSDNPRIPESRRAEVRRVADRLGYRPDPILSALIHYRRTTRRTPIQAALAWLNFWPEPAKLRSYREFDSYWHGATAAAEAHGYRLEEFVVSPRLPIARVQKILLTRNVQGLLLPPAPSVGFLTPELMQWHHFSIVCFGHSHLNLPVHMVTADQAAAGRTALRAIRERGYRRVGFVTTARGCDHTMFVAGYLQAQLQIAADDRLPILTLDEHNRTTDTTALREWLYSNRPDAIVTDLAAVRDHLHAIGVQVPTDLGLAALSVLDGKADAGINQNSEEIGRVAAETLISLINHRHRGIPPFQRHILVEGFWVDGGTLPPRT